MGLSDSQNFFDKERKMNKILLVLCVLVLAALACEGSASSGGSNLDLPTLTQYIETCDLDPTSGDWSTTGHVVNVDDIPAFRLRIAFTPGVRWGSCE